MPLLEFVAGMVTTALKKVPIDLLKAAIKDSDPLASALHRVALKASEDFYEKYADEFGTYSTSFLAQNGNWELVIGSLLYSSSELTADALNPNGFEGAKPATEEAREFFIQSLQARIKGDRALDQVFVEKKHIQEQTEVKEGVQQVRQTLLEIGENEKQTRQDHQELFQRFENMQSMVMAAIDVKKEKETSDVFIDQIIDTYRDLITDNNPSAAILVLEKLKEQKWRELSDRLKFRVATNIAAAKLRIGNNNIEAAQELLEAAKLVPKDKKAICNSVLAHSLLGNTQAALIKAKEAVELFPDDPESYQALVNAMVGDVECFDPLPLIPAEMLSSSNLALQLGDFFQRKGNSPESRKWFERAYQLCNSSVEIQEGYATSQLDEIFSNIAIIAGQQITDAQRKQLQEASDILSAIWTKLKDSEISERYIPCVINLSNAVRLLGNESGALSLIEEALSRHPDDVLLQKHYCFCLISVGRADKVCELLKDIPDDAFEEKLLFEAETLASANKSKEALVKVEKFLSQCTSSDDIKYIYANTLRVQLLEKTENNGVALAEALELVKGDPLAAEYLLLASDLFSNSGDKEKTLEWLEKAREVSLENNSYPEQIRVADRYYELGLYRDAASLYQGLITTYEDSRNLRRLLATYMAGDFRSEALDLIARLPAHVKEMRFYGRACSELFFRLGELPESRRYMEMCIKGAPQDLELLLNYIVLLERMGLKAEVEKFLNQLPEIVDASAECFIKLSHAYARYGMRDKSLQVGYDTLRKFGTEAAAHLGYCGLLLLVLKDIPQIDKVRAEQTVGVNTAFTCRTQSGKNLTFVIEPKPIKGFDEEIPPDHPIAIKAIGLRVNETFVISETPFSKEEATITEVKHKYLHVLHESMENFQYRFPGVPGMWMVGLTSKEDGDFDFKPIFDSVSLRCDTIIRTEDVYATHPLPLALVAHRLGTHPIDCLLGMSSNGRVKIKCCYGDSAERNKAGRAIFTAANGFMIDPFSLFTIYTLDALDTLLLVTKGKLGITQSTLDLFVGLIDERKAMQPCLTLSKKGEQFFRDEISGDAIKDSIVPFETILDWCQTNCEIVPAVGRPGLDGEEKYLFTELSPVFLDTLLAAAGTGKVLISDDLHYRQVASHFFGIEGVWTQPLLQAAIITKAIKPREYHDAVSHLINMNYRFISISAGDLIYQITKHNYEICSDFNRMILTLSERNTDIYTSTGVVGDFLCYLIQMTPTRWKIEKIVYAVLEQLTANPSLSRKSIILLLWIVLVRKMAIDEIITSQNLELIKLYINSWCSGHFINKLA